MRPEGGFFHHLELSPGLQGPGSGPEPDFDSSILVQVLEITLVLVPPLAPILVQTLVLVVVSPRSLVKDEVKEVLHL